MQHATRATRSNTTCACCDKAFELHLMIQCSVCKKFFKNTCVDVSSSEVRTLNANKGYDWSCKDCRAIGNDLKDLKALIIGLQDEIKSLKSESSEMRGALNTNFDFEEIVEEINERNKRKYNLVISGIEEQSQEQSTAERFEKDKNCIKDVLLKIEPVLNVDNIKPVRLGRFSENNTRPRLLKITLSDEQQVLKIVKRAKILRDYDDYKHISIFSDRTPRQIQYYKNVKNQLIERINSGENCRIKYINGVPKIVALNQ